MDSVFDVLQEGWIESVAQTFSQPKAFSRGIRGRSNVALYAYDLIRGIGRSVKWILVFIRGNSNPVFLNVPDPDDSKILQIKVVSSETAGSMRK